MPSYTTCFNSPAAPTACSVVRLPLAPSTISASATLLMLQNKEHSGPRRDTPFPCAMQGATTSTSRPVDCVPNDHAASPLLCSCSVALYRRTRSIIRGEAPKRRSACHRDETQNTSHMLPNRVLQGREQDSAKCFTRLSLQSLLTHSAELLSAFNTRHVVALVCPKHT